MARLDGKQLRDNSVQIGGQDSKLVAGGQFDMGTHGLSSSFVPTNEDDLTNKKYVDDLLSSTSGAIVIGEAEDLDYSDGLFTDFVPTTPLGTAVDRFNEILKALAPGPAPILSNWSASLSGDVSGNLSFGASNTIGGYTNSPVDVDGAWTISGKRLGIKNTSGNITGTLNDQVTTDSNNAYPADSFSDATDGTLTLTLNGSQVGSIDLTTTDASIDTTASNTQSGLTVSAAANAQFSNGDELDLFKNRTGTWRIQAGDGNLVNGYNTVTVSHTGSFGSRNLTQFEFIIDDNTENTSFSAESLSGLSMTGSKYLSGIQYHTGGTAEYNVTIDNLYKNTYYSSSNAITHSSSNSSLSASNQSLGNIVTDENDQVIISAKTATITSNRLINESINLDTTARRTVQSNQTSTGASISGILLDNVSANSTLLVDNFNDEDQRLRSDLNYDLVADVASGAWDSQESLVGVTAGYTDGLQVINSQLVYPSVNFSTITNGYANPNYSTAASNRTFYRRLQDTSSSTSLFTLLINGSSVNFVDLATGLTGNNAHLEIKLPTQTGWLDCYTDFISNTFTGADGDGVKADNNGTGGINNTLGLNVGGFSTANSGNYVVMRITVGSSFSGNLSSMTFTYL